MGTSKRFWTLCAVSATAISAAASGCEDNDHTEICVGPDCANYDGVGGNFFRNNNPDASSGSAGAAGSPGEAGSSGAGGEPPDAGSDAQVDPTPPPDGGGDPPPPECELAFALPVAPGSGDLTVDEASDVDGEACGSSFELAVSLTSNASTVTLFINDNPFATQNVVDGSVGFEAILGNRGSTANVLRAEATMADNSTCSLTFPSNVLVDCAGPSCSVDRPVATDAGYLNSEHDIDGASGFQVDIGVGTELEHAGESVRLEIDGNFGQVPDAVVLEDGGAGDATFGNVTLSEGEHTVRAECSDAFGVTTLSAPVTWTVDITACSLEITELAGGESPITPGSDVDENTPGIQVLATGTITGGDCKTLWIGACGGTPIPVPLTLPEDGSFSLPVTVSGSTGSLDICGAVEDEAGNMSEEDSATVNLRLEAPQVAIASPAANTRYNVLGGSGVLADGNGGTTACEASVVVNCTELGQPVLLLADGVQIDSATCVAQSGIEPFLGRASFTAAAIPTKNDGSNTALTAQHSITGFDPVTSAAISVQADCEAPACSIVGPDVSLDFLNAALDSSGTSGFQIDFSVASDANSVGQSVQLNIDGSSGAPPAALVAQVGGSGVTFTDVDLSEGPRSAQAICADAAGNTRTSAAEGWIVDTVPCGSSLTVANASDPITPSDDGDGGLSDLQVLFNGTTTGGDCAAARVGLCNSLSGSPSSLSGQSFSLSATLPSSTGSANVCAEITDEAGNVDTVQGTFAVRVDPPVVAITAPADLSTFNLLSASQCSTTLEATCTDVGEPVALFVDGSTIASDIQTCQAGNTVSFSVALATKNDGSTTTLAVQQSADGFDSDLDSITVQADCEAPVLAITAPICSTTLGLLTDDEDAAPGLQLDVTVANDGIANVTLSVTRDSSTVETSATGDTISTTFANADLGGVGSVELAACATDPQGNVGCDTACQLTISAEPVVNILNPADSSTLLLGNDCGADAGLQVTVVGTSDAAEGSTVSIQIGAGDPSTTTVTGGGFSACVDAPHGLAEVITAEVTDALSALSGSDSVTVTVNALSSMGAPTPVVEARRLGQMRLNWTAINHPLGETFSNYQVRCSPENIDDEAKWAGATPLTVTTLPAPGGSPQSEVFSGFPTGTSRFCAIRATDALGFITSIGPGESATVSNPFLTNEYTVTTTASQRVGLSAIGDINGDGEDDFIAGSENNGAQIFFGGSLDTTADVSITGLATGRFGSVVAGLGDVNGDTRPDFAVAAPTLANGVTTSAGAVFILFGRELSNPWPATVTLSASTSCGADVCILGTQSAALLGSAVVGANFDGVGPRDVVIGVQGQNTRIGRVYVLLGGTQLTSGASFTLPTGSNPDGFQIDPTVTDSFFGSTATLVGSGGDATDDLVIGAIGRTTGPVSGATYFIPGRAHVGTGLTSISAGAAEQFATGTPAQFATAIGGLGDYNGDGNGDLCVAHDFQTASGGGSCTLYLGRSPGDGGGFSALNALEYNNDVYDNDWAFYVAAGTAPHGTGLIGDLDGDGLGELLLGSLTTAQFNTGTAELFYGATGAPARSRAGADMQFLTLDQGHIAPAFVGDIDGDGFRDLAIFDTDVGSTSRVTLLY